jgi:CheY-like chemotaxis protein
MAGSREANDALLGRVLLLEDEDLLRDIVAALLGRLGLRVTAVAEGAAAIAAFEEALAGPDPFDLVVLDLTVPGGMGGAAVLPRLRALDPGIRAVASSGDTALAGPEFQATLNKPYTVEEARAVLAPLLRR